MTEHTTVPTTRDASSRATPRPETSGGAGPGSRHGLRGTSYAEGAALLRPAAPVQRQEAPRNVPSLHDEPAAANEAAPEPAAEAAPEQGPQAAPQQGPQAAAQQDPQAAQQGPQAAAQQGEHAQGQASGATPVTPNAALAEQLRARYAGGIAVAMCIPDGYLSDAEAIPPDIHSGDGEGWGTAYRVRWVPANPGAMQGFWRGLHAQHAHLPEDFATATGRPREQIISLIWADHPTQLQIRTAMLGSMPNDVGHYIKNNNDEFQRRARQYASENQTVGARGGQVTFGTPMTYASPGELVSMVNEVSAAVAALLGNAPDAARIAKIHSLAIYCHGTRDWMGGQGPHASGASFTTRSVPGIVAGIDRSLANDVRIMLFACSTAHGNTSRGASQGAHGVDGPEADPAADATSGQAQGAHGGRGGQGAHGGHPRGRGPNDDPTHGEGGMADAFRDALVRDPRHANTIVGGHINAGHCERNSPRYFVGASGMDESQLPTRFPEAWRQTELQRLLGRPATPQDLLAFRPLLQSFNRRELLMYVQDLTSAGCQDAWRRFADQNQARVLHGLHADGSPATAHHARPHQASHQAAARH